MLSGEAVADLLTGSDGRIGNLGGQLVPGTYTLVFETGQYFATGDHLFDRVSFDFALAEGAGHHHIPLLLSPFGVSSYRGG